MSRPPKVDWSIASPWWGVLTDTEIAKRLGLAHSSVAEHRRTHRLPSVPGIAGNRRRIAWTPALDEIVLTRPVEVAAELLSIGVATVNRRRQSLLSSGCKLTIERNRPGRRRGPMPGTIKIVELLRSGMSVKRIAAQSRVSTQNVYAVKAKYLHAEQGQHDQA